MSRTKNLYWSVPLDGGGIGSHILRGPFARNGEGYQLIGILPVTPLIFGAGAHFTIGWTAIPGALADYDAVDLSGFTGWFGPSTFLHFGANEPFLVTVTGAAFTAGALEIIIESVRV